MTSLLLSLNLLKGVGHLINRLQHTEHNITFSSRLPNRPFYCSNDHVQRRAALACNFLNTFVFHERRRKALPILPIKVLLILISLYCVTQVFHLILVKSNEQEEDHHAWVAYSSLMNSISPTQTLYPISDEEREGGKEESQDAKCQLWRFFF